MGLSKESTQARVMFEVDACPSHIDCTPCDSHACREEQGELPNRALCFAHECHRCASLLADAGQAIAMEGTAAWRAHSTDAQGYVIGNLNAEYQHAAADALESIAKHRPKDGS